MRPELGLSDLIRAVARLSPLGDDAGDIARVLGLVAPARPRRVAAGTDQPEQRTTRPPGPDRPRPRAGDGSISLSSSGVFPAFTDSVVDVSDDGGPSRVVLRALGRRATAPPAWLTAPAPSGDGPAPAARAAAPPRLETLFEPRRHRALLSAALATVDPRGPLDLVRLVGQIATRRYPSRLPRLPEISLHRGAWLLLDRSPSMAPFFDDVGDLAARIARVVGKDATHVQEFTESPGMVWDAELLDDRPIQLPPRGTPLVAVTDLGVRSGSRGWRALFDRLAARGSRAVAIVPYAVERCPPAIRNRATIVPWDRSTHVRAVKPRVRRSR